MEALKNFAKNIWDSFHFEQEPEKEDARQSGTPKSPLERVFGHYKCSFHEGNDITVLLSQNGVWTGEKDSDGNPRFVDGFACSKESGKFLFVGSNEELTKQFIDGRDHKSVNLIDMRGKAKGLVTPGFHDSHLHIQVGGRLKQGVDITGIGNKTLVEMKLAAYHAEWKIKGKFKHHFLHDVEYDDWIIGGGWSEQYIGRGIAKEIIDRVITDVPVFLFTADLHAAVVNSAALKKAGITKDTENPLNGVIERDENGEPTGILRDCAVGLVESIIPEHHRANALYHAVDHLLENGITSATNMGAGPMMYRKRGSWKELETLQKAVHYNHLHARIYSAVELCTHQELKKMLTEGNNEVDLSPFLRVGLLKSYADGALGSATCFEFKRFQGGDINPEEKIFPHGKRMIENDELERDISAASDEGLNIAIHAIGDHANRDVINIFESAVKKGAHQFQPSSLRLEHGQHITKEDVNRLGELKDAVGVCMNPQHLLDDVAKLRQLLVPTEEQEKEYFQVKSLLNKGVTVAFGSDWPVSMSRPLLDIYVAVNRVPTGDTEPFVPEECISIDQALRCVTVNAAQLSGRSNEVGMIKEGYLADFTIINKSLFQIDPMKIKDTKVKLTAVGGVVRYNKMKAMHIVGR